MKDNKINVDIIVPAIGERYNVFIPVNKSVGEVILILNNSINELTGVFAVDNKLCLYDVLDNKIYNNNIEIIKSGMKNGTILALI